MTMLWRHASNMINELKDRINVVTDDSVFYELRLKRNNAIIGTLKKTYVNHEKIFTYDMRSSSGYFTDTDSDEDTIVKFAKLKQNILTEAMILEVEQL